MSECALCDLPTPDPPVTDGDVDGEYCCRGCLEVGRRLADVATAGPEDLDAAAIDSGADAGSDVPGSAETAYLDVDGLHCSACELFLEAEATDTEGVYDADVSYATDAARVAYDPETVDPADLPGAFDRLGYGASLPDDEEEGAGDSEGWLGDDLRVVVGSLLGMVVMLGYGLVLYGSYLDLAPTTELGVLAATLALGTVYCAVTFALVFGLLEAVALLAVLQSVSFAAILNADALSVGAVVPAVAALATVVVFYTGRPFLRGAYVSLRAGRPNMDLLVALAVLAAWGYSMAAWAAGSAHVYFDVAVMVVLVVTLGNRVEERVKSRAVSGLSAFAAARVEEARRRTADGDGTETVPVEGLEAGDEVVVRAGERVPVDGTVTEGAAAVDESLVTGESVPDTKRPGDEAVGGTVVTDDALVVEVGEGAGSTADRLVDLLWDVRSSRPGVQQVADRLAAVFVPLVVALAVATAGYYLWSGAGVADAVLTGVAVLVVSCPCALGLATPLAVSAGVREALDAGAVVTDAGVFERVRDVDAVVLDKTGTLTAGEMTVEDVTAADSTDAEAVLARAAAVEQFSTHPVAEAVTDRADPPACDVTDFDRKPRGVAGTVDGDRVLVGHPGLFDDWVVPERLEAAIGESGGEGDGAPALVGWDGEVRGVLSVADQPREEWLPVVSDLAAGGREVIVLTGDDPEAAAPFREHAAVSDVFAGVPPEGKVQTVQAVGEDATVAMVGDGSNDAPALAAADLGVAMGSGTELAADAADAVVTTDLDAVPELFGLADAARSRIRQNLAWAFTYNAVAVPLAVAALLNPLFAAVAMATSSLVVVGNSARPLRGGLLSGLLAASE